MSAVPFPPERASVWRRWEFVPAIAFAVWSHAYLGAMSATIILAQLIWLRRWAGALILLAVPVGLLSAIGALSQPRLSVDGAQLFAFDLLAYGQSLNWGIVPKLYPIAEMFQNDTIVYLGTGAWLALIFGIVGAVIWGLPNLPLDVPGSRARFVILLIAGLALIIFAMAFTVRIGGSPLIVLPIPNWLMPVYEAFRAAGRFAGVFAYLLMILAALLVGSIIRVRRGAFVLALVAGGLQVADAAHAGNIAPPLEIKADVATQTEVVDALLSPGWSGRVYRNLNLSDMQEQRLLDYLLVVEHGAVWFATAHGARLVPENVAKLSDYSSATRGDLVVTTLEAGGPVCARSAELKIYRLCIL